jgi:arsenate reductase (glutaredoxin)
MSITLYGIKNCDTVKKARDWMSDHKVAYDFHDYKVSGIDAAHLKTWATKLGWQVLLNKAGTTFKALPEADKTDLDEAKALRLMMANPSMIKRPVFDVEGAFFVGFKPDTVAGLKQILKV